MIEPNLVVHGDCLHVMADIASKSVNMILCDLPYGTTKCKWDVTIPFIDLWAQYERIITDSGAIVLFGTEPFSSALRLSNLSLYRYDWYWQKDKAANFLFGNKMPLKVVETISVFYKQQPVYNAQKRDNPKGVQAKHLSKNIKRITSHVKEVMGEAWTTSKINETTNYAGKNYDPGKLLPTALIYFAKEQRGKIHPTQKPVTLCEYLINTYTNPGEVVLDNCAGSGSVGVACQNLQRRFILIEKSKEYYDALCMRLERNGLCQNNQK